MAKLDTNSEEWQAVEEFIEHERSEAIKLLINDHRSEQQRGIIAILDKLAKLPNDGKARSDDAQTTTNPYNM
jgi:hypothetical protein